MRYAYIQIVKWCAINGRSICIAMFMMLLFGCATTERFEEYIDGWVGQDVGILLKGWGKPEKIYHLENGNSEYEYNLSHGKELPDACIVFFEIDNLSKKVIKMRHEGNRCKRAPSFV